MSTKIAVITDAHANLPALRAALRAIEAEGYDAIVHTGDAIAIGPYPAECLDLLSTQQALTCLMGNHDAWFAYGLPEGYHSWMSQEESTHQLWTNSALDARHRSIVERWPYLLEMKAEDVTVTLLHYGLNVSGRNFAPIIRQPQPGDLDKLFASYSSDLIFYGHHHPFSDIRGRARYINPGSLGCYQEAIARYTLLEIKGGRWTLHHRSVPYDDSQLWPAFELRYVPEREMLWQAFFGGRRRT